MGKAALLGAVLAWAPGGVQAGPGGFLNCAPGVQVPYQGTVEGRLVLDGALNVVEAPPAKVRSCPLGRGRQFYDPEDMQVTQVWWDELGAPGLITTGVARTRMRNGDELRLAFYLASVFVSETEVVYTGSYTILPGGTGRFEYGEGAPEDLGSGEIKGSATLAVDPESGHYIMTFSHQFDGDLYLLPRGWHYGGFSWPDFPEMSWSWFEWR